MAFHRWVAEQKLGRPLSSDEVVHHVDHDKLNNDPDNLVVLSRAEHQRATRLPSAKSLDTEEEKARARALRASG